MHEKSRAWTWGGRAMLAGTPIRSILISNRRANS